MNILYVNLEALRHNINEVHKHLNPGTQIMGIVKANGYGTNAVSIVETLTKSGVSYLGVASVSEAIELREHQVALPILVLNQLNLEDIPAVISHQLTANISHLETVKRLNFEAFNSNKKIKIHIEIDTGMGRTGVQPEHAIPFIQQVSSLENIEIEGIFTHFSSADCNVRFTENQINQFEDILKKLNQLQIHIPIKHACNSAGMLNFPRAHYDMVRPGIMLYGYYPDKSLRNKINLMPCLSLKSEISFIKEVSTGTSISYKNTYITKKITRIATIPLGYADGYKRCLSNIGSVLIKNKRANVVGTICMDVFMVDVSDIPDVKIGDEVIIFDSENITVDEIAHQCETINYEIITSIGNRVKRVYIG